MEISVFIVDGLDIAREYPAEMTYTVRPSTPDQQQLRDATASAKKYKNDDVLIEPGDYFFTTPLQITNGVNGYETISLGGRVRNTVRFLFPSNLTDQCVKLQGDNASYIHDITIVGANTKPSYIEPNNIQTNYLSTGIKADRYLPHAGICIDPLAGLGSTDTTFERVEVENCGVGWLYSPNGSSMNADRIKHFECSAFKCDIGVSHSQSQARANYFINFSLNVCRVGFTGMVHGVRQGVPPRVDGMQTDWIHHLMEYYSCFGTVLDWSSIHAEAIAGIGNWGAGAPENMTCGSIRNSTFSIGMAGWTLQQTGLNNSVPCLFETHAGFEFDSCQITNKYYTNFPFVSGRVDQLKFTNLNISPTITLG